MPRKNPDRPKPFFEIVCNIRADSPYEVDILMRWKEWFESRGVSTEIRHTKHKIKLYREGTRHSVDDCIWVGCKCHEWVGPGVSVYGEEPI